MPFVDKIKSQYIETNLLFKNFINDKIEDMSIPLFTKYNKQVPKDYISDIWSTLKEQQEFDLPEFDFMKLQTEINDKMRAILIDWLIDVHLNFKLSTETLFLTINLIDRYVSKKLIGKNKFQLLGISALFISAKYEEVIYPGIHNFVEITDNTYTKSDILCLVYLSSVCKRALISSNFCFNCSSAMSSFSSKWTSRSIFLVASSK